MEVEKTEEKKSVLDEARDLKTGYEAAADRIEKALAEMKELTAEKVLGGDTEAGQEVKKAEETPAEYAARVTSGGLNEKAPENG